MAHLCIIRGPSGAGKTTLAERLHRAGVVQAHYEADHFRLHTLDGGGVEYVYAPADNRAVHALCQRETFYMLSHGVDVAVSNIFRTVAHMQPYLDYCAEHGHRVTVIRVEGAFQDVHGVSEADKAFMRANFENYPKELN
jgi:predicted kinase